MRYFCVFGQLVVRSKASSKGFSAKSKKPRKHCKSHQKARFDVTEIQEKSSRFHKNHQENDKNAHLDFFEIFEYKSTNKLFMLATCVTNTSKIWCRHKVEKREAKKRAKMTGKNMKKERLNLVRP